MNCLKLKSSFNELSTTLYYDSVHDTNEELCCSSYYGIIDNGVPVHITKWEISLDKLKSQNLDLQKTITQTHEVVLNLSQLEHKNILKFISVSCRVEKKCLKIHLVREMMHGVQAKVFSKMTNWTIRNVRQICHAVVNAMSYLQTKNIPHGNINDSTIILDKSGEWKISDYSINTMLNNVARGQNQNIDVKKDLNDFANFVDSLGTTSLQMSSFIEKCRTVNSFSDLLDHELLRSLHNSFDDFEVLEKLGEGGFGEVLKVKDCKIDKEYAMKRIKNTRKAALSKGMQEVRTLAKLSHKNILRYYRSWTETMNESDYKQYDDRLVEELAIDNISSNERTNKKNLIFRDLSCFLRDYLYKKFRMNFFRKREKTIHVLYIQMELCHRDLRHKMNSGELKSDADIKKIFFGIANGLKFIHSKGRIHRDLKPDNIFLTEDEVVKIGDFGLSTTRKSLSIQRCGTELYMAPEIGKRGVQARADMYSLGIILFEMCYPMKNSDRKRILIEIRQDGAPIEHYVENSRFFEIIKNLLDHTVKNRYTAIKLLKEFPGYKREIASVNVHKH